MRTRFRRALALARYHRPSQFAWRAYRLGEAKLSGLVLRRYAPPKAAAKLSPEAVPCLRAMATRRQTLWPHRHDLSTLRAMAEGRFRFLNVTHDLRTHRDDGTLAIDWRPDAPRLWRFHLQYHESLLEIAADVSPDAAWSIVRDWLDDPMHRSPAGDGDSWHPFCLSQRIPIWLMLAATTGVPADLEDSFWASLTGQVGWLWRRLEWDLGGNHLLENLRALTIADAVLEGEAAAGRRRQIRRWTRRELERQTLASGEHFERTPTYHALMLLAALEIAEAETFADGDSPSRTQVASMARFLGGILHPDGQIPLFGDSVFGETPDPIELCRAAGGECESAGRDRQSAGRDRQSAAGNRQAGPPSSSPGDYWVWRSSGAEDFFVFDIGDVSCDYLPAHGHADLFGFEASLGGRRFLVDTGTFDYEDSADRQRCRSTLSHNTVSIDGLDQCDVWSRFRMGDRGHVRGKSAGAHGASRWCVAWHDAYRRVGVPRLYRAVVVDEFEPNDFMWLIVDWFEGGGRHRLRSRLHFAPEFDVDRVSTKGRSDAAAVADRESFRVRIGGRAATSDDRLARQVASVGEADIKIDGSKYHPDFGVSFANRVLVAEASLGSRDPIGWVITSANRCRAVRLSVTDTELQVAWDGDRENPIPRYVHVPIPA